MGSRAFPFPKRIQQWQVVLEIARLWPHLMRDVLTLGGRTGDVRTGEGTRKLRKRCHTPACFSLFPFCFLSLVFSSSSVLSLLALLLPLLPHVFSFLQLDTINDLNLRSIQTLCLHLSYSTPLHKTQTVNHYLRVEYFQQVGLWKSFSVTHLQLLRNTPLANAPSNKATRNLAVEKRVFRQGVRCHPCDSADVVAAEVVRSPTVKKNRVTDCEEI